MTKARNPSTFADAVTRIAGRIGWTAMAEAVGMTERAVRNWSDPDMDRHPSIRDALCLDAAYIAAGGGEPPIMGVYQVLLDRAVQPPADAAALIRATVHAAKEAGEAVAALVQATAPGALARDRAAADKEVAEAMEALAHAQRQLGGGEVVSLRSAG